MIRNYRLHLVTKDSELTPEDREHLGLNSGTTIYVNNSIIKPEVFNFTTSVLRDEAVLENLAHGTALSPKGASQLDGKVFSNLNHFK